MFYACLQHVKPHSRTSTLHMQLRFNRLSKFLERKENHQLALVTKALTFYAFALSPQSLLGCIMEQQIYFDMKCHYKENYLKGQPQHPLHQFSFDMPEAE